VRRSYGRASGDLALLACACAWGATFPITRAALADVSPALLVAIRFLLATVLLAPWWPRGASLRAASPLGWGVALGAVLACGFTLQTWGLTRIGAGRSAFLTALYVLLTPLIEWGWTRRRPPARSFAGAVLALGGVAAMTGFGGATIRLGLGDLATLAAAAFFALQISLLSRALALHDAARLLILQVAACGALAMPAALLLEESRLQLSIELLLAIVFLGAVATALVLGLQIYGQRRTTPTRAALLFASEPVWAAAIATWLGERMSGRESIGAALIVAGILLGTLPLRSAQGAGSPTSSQTP